MTAGGKHSPVVCRRRLQPPYPASLPALLSRQRALTHEGAQAADEAEEAALGRQGATLAAGTRQGPGSPQLGGTGVQCLPPFPGHAPELPQGGSWNGSHPQPASYSHPKAAHLTRGMWSSVQQELGPSPPHDWL